MTPSLESPLTHLSLRHPLESHLTHLSSRHWWQRSHSHQNPPRYITHSSQVSIVHDLRRFCTHKNIPCPCDAEGNPLPEGMAPPPCTTMVPTNWSPYESEVQLWTADLLYCHVEMSAGNINKLMELWALGKAKLDELGPFTSYDHMYECIGATHLEDAPQKWVCRWYWARWSFLEVSRGWNLVPRSQSHYVSDAQQHWFSWTVWLYAIYWAWQDRQVSLE